MFISLLVLLSYACDARVLEVVREPPPSLDGSSMNGAQDAEITADSGKPVEVCDGLDNDGDGRIDNLDAGADALCDCVRVLAFGTSSAPTNGDVVEAFIAPRIASRPIRWGKASLEEAPLDRVDVIIVEDLSTLNRLFTVQELPRLDAWVRGGGGLFVLGGFGASLDNTNLLLAMFGLGFDPPSPLTPTGELRVDTFTAHPVSANLSNMLVFDPQPTRGLGERLASALGTEVGRVLEVGEGRIVLWGDDFVANYDAFKNRSDLDIPRFWQNALAWLAPQKACF